MLAVSSALLHCHLNDSILRVRSWLRPRKRISPLHDTATVRAVHHARAPPIYEHAVIPQETTLQPKLVLSSAKIVFMLVRLGLSGQSEEPATLASLQMLARSMWASSNVFSPRQVSQAISGLRHCRSDLPEVRDILGALAQKVAACQKPFTGGEIGVALGGLRKCRSEAVEMRGLLSALLPKIRTCTQPPTSVDVGLALSGLRGCSSDERVVRAVLEALAPLIASCSGPMDEHAICNALQGLQCCSGEHAEVRAVLGALAAAIENSPGRLPPLRRSSVAFIESWLVRHSHHAEARALLSAVKRRGVVRHTPAAAAAARAPSPRWRVAARKEAEAPPALAAAAAALPAAPAAAARKAQATKRARRAAPPPAPPPPEEALLFDAFVRDTLRLHGGAALSSVLGLFLPAHLRPRASGGLNARLAAVRGVRVVAEGAAAESGAVMVHLLPPESPGAGAGAGGAGAAVAAQPEAARAPLAEREPAL